MSTAENLSAQAFCLERCVPMKKCFYLLALLRCSSNPGVSMLRDASAQEGVAEPQVPADVTLYVKPLATGSNCSSWANACELQTALGAAVSGDEIWVQAGTINHTSGTDRTLSFEMKSGVAIFGGLPEERPAVERDWAANVTILAATSALWGIKVTTATTWSSPTMYQRQTHIRWTVSLLRVVMPTVPSKTIMM